MNDPRMILINYGKENKLAVKAADLPGVLFGCPTVGESVMRELEDYDLEIFTAKVVMKNKDEHFIEYGKCASDPIPASYAFRWADVSIVKCPGAEVKIEDVIETVAEEVDEVTEHNISEYEQGSTTAYTPAKEPEAKFTPAKEETVKEEPAIIYQPKNEAENIILLKLYEIDDSRTYTYKEYVDFLFNATGMSGQIDILEGVEREERTVIFGEKQLRYMEPLVKGYNRNTFDFNSVLVEDVIKEETIVVKSGAINKETKQKLKDAAPGDDIKVQDVTEVKDPMSQSNLFQPSGEVDYEALGRHIASNCIKNSSGLYIDKSSIKEFDIKKDEIVKAIMAEGSKLKEHIDATRESITKIVMEFDQYCTDNDRSFGGAAGNKTIKSFDGSSKVTITPSKAEDAEDFIRIYEKVGTKMEQVKLNLNK